MGWVKARKGLDGRTKYTAVYLDLQGRERSAGTYSTEKRAVREWHRAEEALRSGKVADPALGRQTLQHYVEDTWLAHHVMEESTREGYVYTLNRYILPELGRERMGTLLPDRVREWVSVIQHPPYKAKPPTVQKAKVVLDAILATAFNDGVAPVHAGRGVRTPPVATKPRRIITAEQFATIYAALPEGVMQLLVETDIESGLRWGELTELRPGDLDLDTGLLTVARAVVHLKSKARPDDERFVVKDYPKDRELRQLKLADHLVTKIKSFIAEHGLGPGDLLFQQPQPTGAVARKRPAELPDPDTLGLTEPNGKGKQYRHGTLTGYTLGTCRCRYCKDAIAAYRAGRRAQGRDEPQPPRTVTTDGHISSDWFRRNVWKKALAKAGLDFHVTPHGLRHAHASWLIAGGADLQVVKERLGHGSIATTERYLHALPDADDTALKALEAVRGAGTPKPATVAEQTAAPPAEQGADPRDAELAELRGMVAKFRDILGPLGDTA